MKAIYITLIFLLLIKQLATANDPLQSGLFFSSHEVNQDLRTSLNLTPTEPYSLQEGFSIEFDAHFRNHDGYFGYIYRIIGNDTFNLDLVANLNTSHTAFWLVAKDNILIGFTWEELGGKNFDDWLPVRLEVDGVRNTVQLSINGKLKESYIDLPPAALNRLDFLFGAHKTRHFLSTDVAPMTIKNIQIKDHLHETLAFWKLDKHHNHHIYDDINGSKATVSNPIWRIDNHTKWRPMLSLSIKNKLGTAIDIKESILYIIGSEELTKIDLNAQTYTQLSYKKGNPYRCRLNSYIYDAENQTIISYSFDNPEPSILDLNTMSWSLDPPHCDLPQYWQHNRIYQNEILTTFGGYGLYTFKNHLQQLDIKHQQWATLKTIDDIEPRYLSAMGQLTNDEVYLFGGFGSKSGEQYLDPHNYYDLHKINIASGRTEKLWDRTRQISNHFVPVESLVPTKEKDGFYTLIFDHSKYETHLNLVKISKDKPEMVTYTDSIPYHFIDIGSWSSLYYLEAKQSLLALTMENDRISLYTMAYPPLHPEDTIQNHTPPSFIGRWPYLILVIILAGAILTFVWLKIKRKKPTDQAPNSPMEQEHISDQVFTRPKVSSILFLGGFEAFDANGKNITSDFTPTLRQLFLIIYFYSVNNKGITSSKLKELIWPDKSDISAKNNRNVNISKLRLILEKIGNVHIDSENSYWKLSLCETVYSDFEEVLKLKNEIKNNPDLPSSKVIRLINLFSVGELCPNIQSEWMDNFKVQFSNMAIDTLFDLLKGGSIAQNQYSLRIGVAETILIHDVLNEEAIKIKCQALFQMGKKGLALQAHEKFAKEYEKMMGTPYTGSSRILYES
ncbi:kelch repeat-containing protein [Anditalea andensis]|uniref:DNA-binding transcriptional activator n=1 Tax=Anditalea andensis TaxID=1048983 RepID=A0A074L3C8_9BACT|nr:kelch repeat-containing protein [Anditalea andensis]KEO75654.1 hypothetical protein EL17_23830 [Anditalea andensis]